MVGGSRKRNLFRNTRKCLNSLTEETAGRIILAEEPLRSGFLQGRKLALSNFLHEELLVCHPEQWAHLVKSIAL